MTLNTTLKQYEQAWRELDRVRSTSSTVRLDKTLLKALLMDHGAMAARLGLADK